jgi:hypothetical protein
MPTWQNVDHTKFYSTMHWFLLPHGSQSSTKVLKRFYKILGYIQQSSIGQCSHRTIDLMVERSMSSCKVLKENSKTMERGIALSKD